jgi:hypothetical protein
VEKQMKKSKKDIENNHKKLTKWQIVFLIILNANVLNSPIKRFIMAE